MSIYTVYTSKYNNLIVTNKAYKEWLTHYVLRLYYFIYIFKNTNIPLQYYNYYLYNNVSNIVFADFLIVHLNSFLT